MHFLLYTYRSVYMMLCLCKHLNAYTHMWLTVGCDAQHVILCVYVKILAVKV